MSEETPKEPHSEPQAEKFVEGLDYYFEDGLFVLTEHYLLKRGYCCQNGCRHCPYGFDREKAGKV
jgi:hypothetical protein